MNSRLSPGLDYHSGLWQDECVNSGLKEHVTTSPRIAHFPVCHRSRRKGRPSALRTLQVHAQVRQRKEAAGLRPVVGRLVERAPALTSAVR